ncbi:outer membrane protein [Sphingosinicella rhizophila]|uniref:Outer membrane beta-barrel protein n=1 Tax=Sphingosinicella rhizophila TaxID=3050082 RepID=A0ABU3Q1V3_9SPHN|nr:outer membrane beta-barrel protein [Sphingosinicella sp. GR2756]MDT9597391.1 outer membrane beta-barrel protein [Sphingosinicella sp. GR2756]
MKFKLILAATAVIAAAAPSMAQVAGGRIEAVVGYDNVRVDLDDFGFAGSEDKSGVVYGIGAGYDVAVGSGASLGIDAEATDASTRYRVVDGADQGRISAGRDLYVGGRITAAVSPLFNLYGKLGYTNARYKAAATIGGTTISGASNLDGIRAGIGGQYLLGANLYVGTEYRYSNYESGVSRHQVVGALGFRF